MAVGVAVGVGLAVAAPKNMADGVGTSGEVSAAGAAVPAWLGLADAAKQAARATKPAKIRAIATAKARWVVRGPRARTTAPLRAK